MEKPPPRDQTGFEIDQSRFSNSPSGESLEYLALLNLAARDNKKSTTIIPRLLLLLPK
ncbi:hypothetical protein DY000_02010629 [Brassica cretica]|uniref:Uncharacterized protein n=1 Tax=Brassica cretica TaxID=69181 RepID=A0ABQ7CBG1_BRACR|nr:hypothetical protein DY000_02010629 [Brassica cretica]